VQGGVWGSCGIEMLGFCAVWDIEVLRYCGEWDIEILRYCAVWEIGGVRCWERGESEV
jgi:hypothetical protein